MGLFWKGTDWTRKTFSPYFCLKSNLCLTIDDSQRGLAVIYGMCCTLLRLLSLVVNLFQNSNRCTLKCILSVSQCFFKKLEIFSILPNVPQSVHNSFILIQLKRETLTSDAVQILLICQLSFNVSILRNPFSLWSFSQTLSPSPLLFY